MSIRFRSTRDVVIRAPDFDSAVRFYESVLGLPVLHRSGKLVGFDAGAFTLYVEGGEAHGPIFEMLVPNLVEATARLIGAGCRIVEEDPTVPRCYIRDPYGFTFNIAESRDAV